jgi:sugar lactone lactonase YvrE
MRLALSTSLILSVGVCSACLAQDMPLSQVLMDGEPWQLVAEGLRYAEGLAVDSEGAVYFADSGAGRIYKLEQGRARVITRQSEGAKGLAFGPDGRLFACQAGKRRVVAYGTDGKESVVADGVDPNDIVINRDGGLYFTDSLRQRVWYVDPAGVARVVDEGLAFPNGLVFWPDRGTLVVADTRGDHLSAYRVERNGDIAFRQSYYPLRSLPGRIDSGADGLAVDSAGRLYATTLVGLQMFDPTGRLGGVIHMPSGTDFMTSVAFGGPKFDELYVTCVDKVFRRKTKTTGLRPHEAK